MPKSRKSDEAKAKIRWRYNCRFCYKALTNKEFDMHVFVCEKVPQEIFHLKTPLGGSSVSFGTNCNSSLTNPLLGAPSDK